jgi:hypothetical protein
MIVSIHQPNYLPWPGYFDKIAKSDVFVLFDDVQFPMGKSVCNRNLIKTNQGSLWLTVPVKDKSALKKINEIEINNDLDWRRQHWKNIRTFYCKASFFPDYEKIIEAIYLRSWDRLCDLNIALILAMLKILEIGTKIVLSSQLDLASGGEQKLIDIVKNLHADAYLTGTGPGSQRYVKAEDFKNNHIALLYHGYKPKEYPQLHGAFIPNLSAIDLLFNLGPNAKKHLQEKPE